MRIKSSTSFPHPVLSDVTSDYTDKSFDLELEVSEVPESGNVALNGVMYLDESSIQSLIDSQQASMGLMISCQDTYWEHFLDCPTGEFELDLPNGSVRGAVYVRGVVVAAKDELILESDSINDEFPASARILKSGDFIALTTERRFEAGLEKLAPLESIFRLRRSDETIDRQIEIGLDSEAIVIQAPPSLYEVIYNLRNTGLRTLLLSSLYLPVVMSVLDAMRAGDYADRRWYSVIASRCSAEGIDFKSDDLVLSAQSLLDGPLASLQKVMEGAS